MTLLPLYVDTTFFLFYVYFSFLSSGDIACMAICSSNYSTIMAFCFLEELQWEFAASYDTTSISLASRPYAFLEFGLYLCSLIRISCLILFFVKQCLLAKV